MKEKTDKKMDEECEACTAPLDEAQQCAACGADNSGGGVRYRYFSMKIFAECPDCKHRNPINGPQRVAHCDQCQTELDLVAHWSRLSDTFKVLLRTERRFGSVSRDSGQWQYKLELAAPTCTTCHQPLLAARFPLQTDGPSPCPDCGAPAMVSPPPPWLKEVFPKVEQLFDAEAAPEAPGGSPAVAPAQEVKPVFFQCPGCGGNLSITGDSKRTVTCEYCEAAAYLPDPLWRQLHPVRKARPWTLRIRAPKGKDKHIKKKGKKEKKEKKKGSMKRWLG